MKKIELEKNLQKEIEDIKAPYVLDKVLSSDQSKFKETVTEKRPTLKTRWLPLSISAFVLILAIIFAMPILTFDSSTFATISIDVNPSIELQLNQNNEVIDITALNDDGSDLLLDFSYKRKTVDVVLENLTNKLIEQGYITPQEKFFYLTVNCDDSEAKAQIEQKIKNKIIESCQKRDLQLTDDDVRFGENSNSNLGQNHGISQGKYDYILEAWETITNTEFESFEDFLNEMKDRSMAYIRNYVNLHS